MVNMVNLLGSIEFLEFLIVAEFYELTVAHKQ